MKKRVERISKRDRFTRMLSGLFVGGILLFQGTGFITDEARAADPVARNRDVTSFIGTNNLSDANYNYGLYGSPLSQTVNISNGVDAVIGKLTADSTSLNPAEAVTMQINSGATLRVGRNEAGPSGVGSLYVMGPWGAENVSKLTALSGASVEIGSGGSLAVGYVDSGQKGLGTLTIAPGAQLVNNGTGSSGYKGLVLLEGSVIDFGQTEGGAALTDFYSGAGIFRNFGTVNVHNGASGSDAFIVSDYIDSDSTYGHGTLHVSGDALLGSSALSVFGTVKVGGNLDISSGSSEAVWGAVGTVQVDGLTSVYNDNSTTGSDLTVRSAASTVGGLWVKRFSDSFGTATGGALTLGTSSDKTAVSVLNVSGLDSKFHADGTRSAGGLYDLRLDDTLKNYGKINLDDKQGSGILFTGASSYTDTFGDEVEGVVGFNNESVGTIDADGDLRLYGVDRNREVSGHSALAMSNKGTINVAGDFDIDSDSEVEFTNTGKVTTKSMTVAGDLTVTNATGGTFTADEVTLDGGRLANAGTYTFNTLTLTDGTMSGTYTGSDSQEEELTIHPTVAVNGMIALDGTTEFAKGSSEHPTTLIINGTGGFQGGGHELSFGNTAVKNNGNLTAAALSADRVNFKSGASYEYNGTGTNLFGSDTTFASGATLVVDADNPLDVAAGKTLKMGATDSYSTIVFDIDGAEGEMPLITLLPAGGTSAAAEIHGNIEIEDTYKSYTPGKHEITLIKTSNDQSIYDIDAITVSGGASNNTLFTTRQGRVSDDKTSYLLGITNKGFSDFAETVNQRSVANGIDTLLRNPESISDELGDFITRVMDLESGTDPRTVGRVLDALSGANRANALMLAMTDPWRYSFDQLGWQTHRAYTPECTTCGSVFRGQMEYSGGEHYDDGMVYVDDGYPIGSVFGYNAMAPNSVWAAAHTMSFNARDDDNCDKYGITNTGISLGYDALNAPDAVLGLAFDYSQPYLYSSWEDVSQHIDQSNFNLGLYGRRDYWNGVSLTGYVGFGLQHMNSKRNVRMGGIDPDLEIADRLGAGNWYRSSNNGQSLAAAVKIARDMQMYNWCVFRPLVQFDTQQVWLEEAGEYGNAIALNYNKTDWNRTFVRAGFETEKNTQFVRLTSKFLYARQIGGDSFPEMTAYFAGDATGTSMTIYGVDLGKDYLDAGIGALGYLDCDYRWALSGNYDFVASEQSTAHVGTVAMSYTF